MFISRLQVLYGICGWVIDYHLLIEDSIFVSDGGGACRQEENKYWRKRNSFFFFLIGMEEEKLFNYQWEKMLVKLIKKNWEKMLVKALNRGALNMHKKLLLSVDKVWCLLHFVYQLSNDPCFVYLISESMRWLIERLISNRFGLRNGEKEIKG